jgi:hypothetical protein
VVGLQTALGFPRFATLIQVHFNGGNMGTVEPIPSVCFQKLKLSLLLNSQQSTLIECA